MASVLISAFYASMYLIFIMTQIMHTFDLKSNMAPIHNDINTFFFLKNVFLFMLICKMLYQTSLAGCCENSHFDKMELLFLEGNEIKKVLRALDSLEAVLPSELTPFLDYFRAFKKVRDGSFNSHTYDVNTPVYIEEVVKTAKALKPFGLNFIPKLHMMLHVPAFCERVGAPLGKFGDQGIEQVLYVCLSVWFKVLFLHLSSLPKAQSKPRCIQIRDHIS